MSEFLQGRVCLVTGGTQGLGWAIVQALADHGGQVFACGVSAEHLTQAEAALSGLPWGERISLARCDVADQAAVKDWIGGIHRQTGRIDVLVNNAAFVRSERFLEMPVEVQERLMRVSYDALVYTTAAVLPWMLAAGQGQIINIGSSAGKIFHGGVSAPYAAAKAAIDGYTQTLQAEFAAAPIHFTLVRPAVIAGTDFFRRHTPSANMPRLADFLPYLTPPQVALAVVEAIRRPRRVVDIPGWLKLFYLFDLLAPRLVEGLIRSGSGRRDYGQVEWQYRPRN